VISLAEIDDIIAIAKYVISLLYSKQEYKLDSDSAITDASSIPKFVLKLGTFFSQIKLKRGKFYTKLHLIYTTNLEDIIDNLKEELSNYSFTIYKQILQHWDITLGGWVVYFNLRNNSLDLYHYLVELIRKKVNFELVFAFKIKKVFNGFQSEEDKKGKRSFNKKVQD